MVKVLEDKGKEAAIKLLTVMAERDKMYQRINVLVVREVQLPMLPWFDMRSIFP